MGGLLLAMGTAPKLNAAAWFALAVAAPAALLAIAAAATQVGASRAAGFCAAMLLAPAIVLAVRALETRKLDPTPDEAREQDLQRAFCLTTGQACGLLFVVAAGAKLSGESVAVGLTMAGVPLALAVAGDIWRRIFPPIADRPEPKLEVSAGRNWMQEWADAERLQPTAPRPITVTPIMLRAGGPTSKVTLEAAEPPPVDEDWMRRGSLLARLQNGNGWISGPTQPRRAAGLNSTSRVQ